MIANNYQKSIIILLLIFLSACKKDSLPPTIDTGLLLSAKGGATITITGQNLTAQGNPTVTLNKKQLTIQSASNSSLTVLIPKMIGSGQLTLTVDGKAYNGPAFSYQYVATVTTYAGNGQAIPIDGYGSNASFYEPWGIVADKNGDLYVCDSYARLIRKIAAGTRQVSSISFNNSLDFFTPYNIALDTINHVLFITDFNEHVMRMNTDGTSQAVIYATQNTLTDFTANAGIAIGPDGYLYVSDYSKGNINKMSSTGTSVSTYATGLIGPRNLIFDSTGELFVGAYDRSNATSIIYQVNYSQLTTYRKDANFSGWEIAKDTYGNFYEADHFSNTIKLIDPNGSVITLAGNGKAADIDGVGTNASFNGPCGLAIDNQGNLFVSTYNFDTGSGNKIRKIIVE